MRTSVSNRGSRCLVDEAAGAEAVERKGSVDRMRRSGGERVRENVR
jgi:hypothetical protein